jgi:hypothetical protein
VSRYSSRRLPDQLGLAVGHAGDERRLLDDPPPAATSSGEAGQRAVARAVPGALGGPGDLVRSGSALSAARWSTSMRPNERDMSGWSARNRTSSR